MVTAPGRSLFGGPQTPEQRRALLDEKTEVLDGTRRRQVRERMAVRIEDMDAVLRLKAKMQSNKVTGSVTVADFNALYADLKTVFDALRAVSDALALKIEPAEPLK